MWTYTRNSISEAYVAALALWPNISVYGVLIANTKIDVPTAIEINKLFCEVVIAANMMQKQLRFYKKRKIELFSSKWSRVTSKQVRSCLNGLLFKKGILQTILRTWKPLL
jgi:phosphoribosylaminoimidazolecarboxamide formyltransferase/IMP cyclohydrolase